MEMTRIGQDELDLNKQCENIDDENILFFSSSMLRNMKKTLIPVQVLWVDMDVLKNCF